MRFRPFFFLLSVGFVLTLATCKKNANTTTEATIMNTALLPEKTAFQTTLNGKQTDLFFLKNKNGVTAAITNYGGRLVSLLVPDRDGKLVDVVHGFGSIQGYLNGNEIYFGATIGRYGNRIAKGKFTLDGNTYTLPTNNGANTLHGGKPGFEGQVWDATQPDSNTLILNYLSEDDEQGFPGNLNVKVTYHLSNDNELSIDYEATTDKKTVVNLTNHAFFNLSGENAGPITDHILMINAELYTPVDTNLIPLGPLVSVENTPFDFRQPTEIGKRIDDTSSVQIKNGIGYDHNFVLNKADNSELQLAATVLAPKTGIFMEVFTQEPGIQLYSGNFLKGKDVGKSGKAYEYRTSFCLETQHFPDSPNQPSYPSTVLNPGDTYRTRSFYKFSVKTNQ